MTTRNATFAQAGYEVEGGTTPAEMVQALKGTLLPLLEAEKAAIEAEVVFLKEVHEGITRGSALETSSSIFVDMFLTDLADSL